MASKKTSLYALGVWGRDGVFWREIRYQGEKSVVEFTICIDMSSMGGGIIGVLTIKWRIGA